MRDAGHRTPDIGQRTSDGGKSKNNISTPQGGGHNNRLWVDNRSEKWTNNRPGKLEAIPSTIEYPQTLSTW